MFVNSKSNPHPFHVKSSWQPPPQQLVTLENYLERTKLEIANLAFSDTKETKTHAQSF